MLGALIRAIDRTGFDKNEIVLVSGIGCSGRLPVYVDFNTLHTTHGRALTFATGVKLAKPNLKVIVVMGDGDAVAIGGNLHSRPTEEYRSHRYYCEQQRLWNEGRAILSYHPLWNEVHDHHLFQYRTVLQYQEALGHFRRAADLQPGSAVMHSNLGGALMAAGRPRDALASVRRALAIDPGYAPALDNLRRLEGMGIR